MTWLKWPLALNVIVSRHLVENYCCMVLVERKYVLFVFLVFVNYGCGLRITCLYKTAPLISRGINAVYLSRLQVTG